MIISGINQLLGITNDYPFISTAISLIIFCFFLSSLLNIFASIFKGVGGWK